MKSSTTTFFSSPFSYPWIVLAVCWLGGVFAGMDANLFSVMLSPVIGDIAGHPGQAETIRLGSYVLSTFLFGWMVGGIVMGLASDYLGRVKMLALSIVFYACFTGLTAYAQSIPSLACCRFGTGLGVGGTMVGISIFLSETWRSSSRAAAIGVLVTSYQVGVLLSGTISHFFPEWRSAFAMGAFPVVIAACVLGYFREPALKTEEKKESSNSFNQKHLWIGGILFGSLLVGYWASLTWIPTWMQGLLGDHAIGHEKNFATMLHGSCAIAGCLIAGPLSDWIGRRAVIFLSYSGALVVSLWMFLGHETFTPLLYVYFGALGFFIGVAQAVMYIYLPELFSRRVRATCVGFCLNAGRLVTGVAILFMGIIIQWFGGYVEALSAFSAIYAAGVAFSYFAPETKSNELPN